MSLIGSKRKLGTALLLVLLLSVLYGNSKVYASQAGIFFGEDVYSIEEETFSVEVLIRAEGNIGSYEVNLRYDTHRMEYVSGAEEESQGMILLEGTGFGREIAYTLEFRAIGAGNAGLAVRHARICSIGEETAEYTVDSLAEVLVNIQGEETGESSFFEQLREEELQGEELPEEPDNGTGLAGDIPIAGSIVDGSGNVLYIVDLVDYEPNVVLWDYKLVTGRYQGEDLTYISDNARNVRVVLMVDEQGAFRLYAYKEDTNSFYPVDEISEDGETCYILSLEACISIPEGISEEELQAGTVFYGIRRDGTGGCFRYTTAGVLEEWSRGEDAQDTQDTEDQEGAGAGEAPLILMLVLALACLLSVGGVLALRKEKIRRSLEDRLKKAAVYMADKKKYLFVLRELTSREVKRKYARSHLGIVWSVLNPLLMMIVMSMVFSYMFKRSIDNFPLYYLTGSLFWNLFSDGTSHAMSALVDNKSLLVKAKLPRQIFIVSRMLTALVNLGYSCIPYVLMLAVFGIRPTWTMLLLPLDIALTFAFAMGIGYLLSILYVFFADIKYLYGVFLRILIYLTALFYPVSSLPGALQTVIGYNPVYLSIYIARECMVYGRLPHYTAWLKLALAAVVSCGAGWAIFHKKQNDIMQRI